MSLDYIRKAYNVPARRGTRVRFDGGEGAITSGDHHVVVKPDQWPNARLRYHPDDLEYLDDLPLGNEKNKR